MTQSLSLIHPEAPEFLSAAALYSAPIDVEAAVARIRELWNEDVDLVWEKMPIEGNGGGGGDILRFVLEGVLVLVTPVPAALQPERGELPDHAFHVAITCYAPLDRSVLPRANSDVAHSAGGVGEGSADGLGGGGAGEPGASESRSPDVGGSGGSPEDGGGRDADPAGDLDDLAKDLDPAEGSDAPEAVRRRKRALASHIVFTELADALMREESAVGLFRPELGVVQPPRMVVELADLLSKGQAPIPLWVGIRVSKPDLVYGRTLGLPLFGHLDLEVVGSLHSEEEVYAMLSNVVDYLLSADAFLLPGQSVGYRDGKDLAISQAVSPADRAAVLHIGF